MSVLDELNALPSSERYSRLGHRGTRDALVSLGTQSGLAWLEEHIESPIYPEWGWALYAFKPEWAILDRWIRLSKLHALAAIDALLMFGPDPHFDDDKKPELPIGANPQLIDNAINFALEHYGNPRLKDAAKRIRQFWPVGRRPRHSVSIPTAVREFAATLFCNDPDLMRDWIKMLETAITPPQNINDLWQSLLQFGDRKNVVAIIDWKEFPIDIIESLRHLRSAAGLPILWQEYSEYANENENLLRDIATQIEGTGRSLVSLDTGGDSYALTFIARDTIPALESLIAPVLDQPHCIQQFEKSPTAPHANRIHRSSRSVADFIQRLFAAFR